MSSGRRFHSPPELSVRTDASAERRAAATSPACGSEYLIMARVAGSLSFYFYKVN